VGVFRGGKLHEIREKGKEEIKDQIQKRLETFCEREFLKDPECRGLVASIEVVEWNPRRRFCARPMNWELIWWLGGPTERACWSMFLGERSRKKFFIVSRSPSSQFPFRKKTFELPLR